MRQPALTPETVTVHVPFRFAKRGGRKAMVLPTPAPDPWAVWLEWYDDGTIHALYENPYWGGKPGGRKKRATAMLKRAGRGDWKCLECGELLPFLRRVDAIYCNAGCRKRAARRRAKRAEYWRLKWP